MEDPSVWNRQNGDNDEVPPQGIDRFLRIDLRRTKIALFGVSQWIHSLLA
jgi:hypothetical protein